MVGIKKEGRGRPPPQGDLFSDSVGLNLKYLCLKSVFPGYFDIKVEHDISGRQGAFQF